jgi:hypothetical protein
MYQNAKYIGDEDLMREKVFPFMKEAAMFYVHHMTKDSSGTYNLYPANVHENLWRVKNPHTDLSAIRRCFPIILDLYDRYGIESEEKQQIKDLLENLAPFPTGKYLRDYNVRTEKSIIGYDSTVDIFSPGIIMEDTILHNRHIVDTYSSYPFELTTKGHPLYDKAVSTLRNRLFPNVEYALTKPMMAAAVLELPEDAKNISEEYVSILQLANGGVTWPEMFGNLSMTIHYMFLHSYDSLIKVFPSIPANWNASYKLLAMGPSEVFATYKNGQVSFLEIKPLKDQKIKIRNPWDAEVIVYDGEEILRTESDLLSWTGKKNRSYQVYPSGLDGRQLRQDTFNTRKRNRSPRLYEGQVLGSYATN